MSDLAEGFLKKKWANLDFSGVSTLLGKYLDGKPVIPTLPNLVAMLPAVSVDKSDDNDSQAKV